MKRNSAYDLMKIISMFLIVLCHILTQGRLIARATNPTVQLLLELLLLFTIVHVNSFVLVTGYFQCEQDFRMSKVWKLINSSLFYKITIMLIASLVFGIGISALTVYQEIFPLEMNEYWFIKVYIILYCFSPFINIGIKHMNQKQHLKLLLVFFLFYSVIPYFTGYQVISNNGYNIIQFVYIYLIGAYLRKYPIEKSYLGRVMSKNLFRLSCLGFGFFCLFGNFCMKTTAMHYVDAHQVIANIASSINDMTITYGNPWVVLQSISYFLFFGSFAFSNKWMNRISECTLGVYLIHENSFVKRVLYEITRVHDSSVEITYSFVLYGIGAAFVIFVVCLLIEFIRQCLFKFIYRRNFSKRLREKYHQWMNSLRFVSP